MKSWRRCALHVDRYSLFRPEMYAWRLVLVRFFLEACTSAPHSIICIGHVAATAAFARRYAEYAHLPFTGPFPLHDAPNRWRGSLCCYEITTDACGWWCMDIFKQSMRLCSCWWLLKCFFVVAWPHGHPMVTPWSGVCRSDVLLEAAVPSLVRECCPWVCSFCCDARPAPTLKVVDLAEPVHQ